MAIVRTRQQTRRAIRMLIIRLFTTAMLGLAMFAAYQMYDVLTTNEKFAVKDVEIRGFCRVDSLEVEKLVAGMRGENLFLLSLDRCAERSCSNACGRIHANHRRLSRRTPIATMSSEPSLDYGRCGWIGAAANLGRTNDRIDPRIGWSPVAKGLARRAPDLGLCADSDRDLSRL